MLHLWNERVKNFIASTRVNASSYITCENYSNLARHVVGSTFAFLASLRCSTCWPSTTYVGIKTENVLQIHEYWVLEGTCFGWRGAEVTFGFICRFLPHVNSSCAHILAFGACALKQPGHWRAGLTWPDVTNFGKHIPGNLKQRGRVELHHRKTIRCFATPGLPLQSDWNTLSMSYRRLLISTPDTKVSTKTISIILIHFDVLQRRFPQSVVGPPRNMDWTLPWHEILHQWNGRLQTFMEQSRCKWSEIRSRHHWNLTPFFNSNA